MSDMIGKWLTRDGRTVVIFAEDEDGRLYGVVLNHDGRWEGGSWSSLGFYGDQEMHSRTLSHKVSDSTNLTRYVPTKRVRPWTEAEVRELVKSGPVWVKYAPPREDTGISLVIAMDEDGIRTQKKLWSYAEAATGLVQLDGSPCGVEVEE